VYRVVISYSVPAPRAAGFTAGSIAYVATLHRYGARVPGAAHVLRWAERVLPEKRRSMIVGAYRAT
jgi:hypothetical protein